MIQLLTQFALINQVGQWHFGRTVDQTEFDVGVRLVVENALAHQQLIKVGIDQGSHNWINLPFVVPNACCNIDHFSAPDGCLGA